MKTKNERFIEALEEALEYLDDELIGPITRQERSKKQELFDAIATIKAEPGDYKYYDGYKNDVYTFKTDPGDKTAEKILARCTCIDIKELEFKNEVQIIRPSEALEAMYEYAESANEVSDKNDLIDFIKYKMLSQYNLSHNEINNCCGVFNIMDEQGIIHCNECNKTLHESIVEYMNAQQFQSLPELSDNRLQSFMDDIHKWADETFGTERTALAPLHHLLKEVQETIDIMQTHNSLLTIEEISDCFILILNVSSKYGLTFAELLEAAEMKMIKNKSRKWGKPDKNGVVEHIR